MDQVEIDGLTKMIIKARLSGTPIVDIASVTGLSAQEVRDRIDLAWERMRNGN